MILHGSNTIKDNSIKFKEKVDDHYREKISKFDKQIDEIDEYMREDNISTEEYKSLVLKK